LENIAVSAANAHELERLQRELFALTEVAKTLTSPHELADLLRAALDKLAEVFEPAELGVVLLWDESSGLFRPEAAFGFNFDALREMGLRFGESITGKVYDAGVPHLLTTPEQVFGMMADMRPANRAVMTRALGTETLPHSTLAVPLRVGERRFGVLLLHSLYRTAKFTEHDVPFVETVADLMALAIDRLRLEEKSEAIRDAQKADQLRSEIMATLSHELRTPLAAIKGYSTAMLMEEVQWPEDKRREFLSLIDAECDNLQSMIGEILDSSLIDVGQLHIELQPVRLQYIAREAAEEMQHRTDIHRIVVDIPPSFPIVDADPRRIKQVMRNILDNAIKYSPNGGLIMIRGQVRATDVVISVSDQGVGISPEDLIPLFEKYFRVKSPTGYNVPGTGLGLPVARGIVEAHGGRIWAESKVSQGTTLSFSLPRAGLSYDANIKE
jgi:K+-sensing histidine kinase KdpD